MQQFIVDSYTMIEMERLNYIRGKQTVLRSEKHNVLSKQREEGQTETSTMGQQVIIPSSFTGGARYMMQNYLDAMAI